MSRHKSKSFDRLKPGDQVTITTHRPKTTMTARILWIDKLNGHFEMSLIDTASRQDMAIATEPIDKLGPVWARKRKRV